MRKISILVFAAVFIAALLGCGAKDAESVAKDVVIVVPPVRGTMTGPSLAYAYDGKEKKQ